MSGPDAQAGVTGVPDRVRLFEHNGRSYVHVPDTIAPRRVRDVLCEQFGATVLRRQEDPLGDWVDLHLAIGKNEFVLSVSNWGIDLYVPAPHSCDILDRIVEPLAAALHQ